MISVIAKIAKARADFTDIKKDVKGYDYVYADLDGIVKAIEPGLVKQELHFWHTFEQTAIGTTPYLNITCHVGDGESEISTTIPLSLSGVEKGRSPAQEMGKILTYGRRYSLTALLGLTADQDTDAQPEKKQDYQRQAPPPSRAQQQAPVAPKPMPKPEASNVKGYADGKAASNFNGRPFVDSDLAWKWLDGLMDKHGLSQVDKAAIKETAVGRKSDEIEAEVVKKASQPIKDLGVKA